ncbi:uncharacterized protein L969DRAFT_606944 [Mixia osmundae IAM 14324]|uniref:2-(3-amino-3-carboxypropyl)histidine synthase subunit 2 n=1 Tax=Mixia osmundae (strain CBS 9802 / IAM 14324 / JCM 22182 / KY 12970) TaxID=764103 RepID=G7E328_MIXOS|nr:uncharacterized protein L969DRAFT_606944 [Mixia osmundae IAM 14324]KEI42502.1 hypothetical protein L969DRAFT_606944 [Mixia osmundae IAM 14324]GAA97209.1 hypothetical protein E5Q_03885 [Mixia osmundae IAM 14324]
MTETPPAITGSGEASIRQQVDVQDQSLTTHQGLQDLLEAYEVERTCRHVEALDAQRIALQFPDELLPDAVPIYRALRSRIPLPRELYVLADTTFGSCCIDEVAAQHVDADLVVHYGHACLSVTPGINALYVFLKRPLDAPTTYQRLASAIATPSCIEGKKAVLLLYDVAYCWAYDDLVGQTRDHFDLPVIVARIDDAKAHKASTSQASGSLARSYHLPSDITLADCLIAYVGEEGLSLNNVLITHSSNPVFHYCPSSGQVALASGRTNKLLMKRYVAVQKAKDADVFGLVIGTLSIDAALPLITALRRLLKRKRKKVYTLAVGKLNPAKLANFLEVDCFVLIACPEHSLLGDAAKEYHRPIISPHELFVALNVSEWSGDYILDFNRLLGLDIEGNERTADDDDNDDDESPAFSLITGQYRTVKRFDTKPKADTGESASQAIAVRSKDTSVAESLGSAAGMHLSTRSYRGLEPRYGLDPPAQLESGRSGIARQYDR